MNRFFVILFSLSALALVACADEEDTLLRQKDRMISYLKGTHNPRLIPEEELTQEDEAAFYTSYGNDEAFRYIDRECYYDPERPYRAEVTPTSKVTLVYSIFVFNFQNIRTIPDGGITPANAGSITLPLYTNDWRYRDYLEQYTGLTPGLWPLEVETFDLRSDNILKALRTALVGCRAEDKVELFLTYKSAYGSKQYMYNVEKESPIAIFFSIEKVE